MTRTSYWNKDHQILSLLYLICQVLSTMEYDELRISPSSYSILYLFSKALQEEDYYLPTLNECNAYWKHKALGKW